MSTSSPVRVDTISVVVCDRREIFRRGVQAVLEESGVAVVGEAAAADELLAVVAATRPDVVILGSCGAADPATLCHRLRATVPTAATIILTPDDAASVSAAFAADARGYLLSTGPSANLVGAVREVASGRSMIDPVLTRDVLERIRNPRTSAPRWDQLSAQDRELLDLLVNGLTNREIGERMHLAEKTVKNRLSRLFIRLGVQRRTQAALLGRQMLEQGRPTP